MQIKDISPNLLLMCFVIQLCDVRRVAGLRDVEMAGMTMTLVVHMRVMSSIVSLAVSCQPAQPGTARPTMGIIRALLSSL